MIAKKGKITFTRRPADDAPESRAKNVAKKKGKKKEVALSPLEKTILRDKDGEIDVLDIPAGLLADKDKIHITVAKVTSCEHIMFQGIRSPHLIAQAMSITVKDAERLVEAVYTKWAISGGKTDVKQQRGEALEYLDYLQAELWGQLKGARQVIKKEENKGKDGSASLIARQQALIVSLNAQIISLNTQRTQLTGLTPQVVNNLVMMSHGDGEENYEVLKRIKQQKTHRNILLHMADVLREQRMLRLNSTVIEG